MATAMAVEDNFEDDQLSSMTTDDIVRASRLLDNEIRVLKVPDLFILLYLFKLIPNSMWILFINNSVALYYLSNTENNF